MLDDHIKHIMTKNKGEECQSDKNKNWLKLSSQYINVIHRGADDAARTMRLKEYTMADTNCSDI
jgi:hypothetical protein